MQLSHVWSRATPIFDDESLVSLAGLAPVMGLAERAGLSELIGERVAFKTSRIRSAGVNPAGKIASIIAGMAAGADCIDDLDVIRSGGMPRLFAGVYACATVGQLLREFTHGHALQLASAARAHLVNLIGCSDLLPGIEARAFIDIDSLLRPVFGHAKQGASYGHTKIAGKQVLRKGLSPLATTISTEHGAPVVSGIRLRAGRAGSGKAAAWMVREAIRTARAAGATGTILVRGDSAYGTSAVVRACLNEGAQFSVVLAKNAAVNRAIASIGDHAWTPVHYPGAVLDPDTGQLISDAEVAAVEFTAFASTKHPVTARLIVRRVRDRAKTDELFPVWRYHPFFTNNTEPVAQADITHRRHAIIETVFADLIDGPLAHHGHPEATAQAWLPALLTCGGLTALCAVLAGRGSPVRRAALYATASGIVWAALATFLKSVTDALAANGVPAVLAHGAVYGVVVAGLVGTVLTQAALHYGPLAVSQPVMVIVNPFLSIILGVWLYGEHFIGGALQVSLGAVGFAVMVVGVVFLANTAPSFEAAPVAASASTA